MTKIQELEQKLNEINANFKAEFYDLQHELAELKESKKEKWKPALREEYWFRNVYGVFDWCKNGDQKIIDWQYNNVPIFKTREECEKYWHFRDTVKEKSYEFSREEWTNCDIPKYVIKYLGYTNEFKTGCFDGVRYLNTIYFRDKESAQYIIDNFKEELLKYWL